MMHLSPLRASLLFSFGVAILSPAVLSWQQTHVIEVGEQGSFFNPPTVSAQVNDTVVFYFSAAVHSVIQSSYDSPCAMLSGGFSSGIVGRANDTLPAPTWNLTITNATVPIWYFCGSTNPTSHCTSGMVGAINPPSTSAFQDFLAAAKKVSNPSTYTTVALTGQGAYATQGPVSVPTPTTADPASSSPNPSTAPSTPPPPHHRKAAAIGASIGTILGVLLLLFLGVILYRCYRTPDDGDRRGSDEFFRYKARSLEFENYTPQPCPRKKKRTTFVPSRMIAPPLEKFRQFRRMTNTDSAPDPVSQQKTQPVRPLPSTSILPPTGALPSIPSTTSPPRPPPHPPSKRVPPPPIPPPAAPPADNPAAPLENPPPASDAPPVAAPAPPEYPPGADGGVRPVAPPIPITPHDTSNPAPPSSIVSPTTHPTFEPPPNRHTSTRSIRALPRLPSSPTTSLRAPLPQPPGFTATLSPLRLPRLDEKPPVDAQTPANSAALETGNYYAPNLRQTLFSQTSVGVLEGTETPPPKYHSHGGGGMSF